MDDSWGSGRCHCDHLGGDVASLMLVVWVVQVIIMVVVVVWVMVVVASSTVVVWVVQVEVAVVIWVTVVVAPSTLGGRCHCRCHLMVVVASSTLVGSFRSRPGGGRCHRSLGGDGGRVINAGGVVQVVVAVIGWSLVMVVLSTLVGSSRWRLSLSLLLSGWWCRAIDGGGLGRPGRGRCRHRLSGGVTSSTVVVWVVQAEVVVVIWVMVVVVSSTLGGRCHRRCHLGGGVGCPGRGCRCCRCCCLGGGVASSTVVVWVVQVEVVVVVWVAMVVTSSTLAGSFRRCHGHR